MGTALDGTTRRAPGSPTTKTMSDRSTTADRTSIGHPTTTSRSTATNQSTNGDHAITSDRSTTCPLCQYTGESQNAVYMHLLASHRKSRISEQLLEWRPTETSR